ncbi:MAG: AI-2E family transporter [Deltaproteobacteria bacterium]|nr:AI-2E family transporter [Deltaproteobacteria bacterium]
MEMQKVRKNIFLAILMIGTIAFLWLLKPFAYPIFWGAVIAGLFGPLYKRVNRKLGHPNVSTAILLVMAIFVIILPLAVIASVLLTQAIDMYSALKDTADIQQKTQGIINLLKGNPYLQKLDLDEMALTEKFYDISGSISKYIVGYLTDLTQNTLLLIINFVVMLYCLFFFIRDGDRILRGPLYILELKDEIGNRLYERFTSTARATLKGTLIIGLIQGTMGGILFWAVGINSAIVWGVIMVLAAMIPGIGCAIIWAPAALIMLATGHVWEGIVILAAGTLVISSIDNILRPLLVGKDTQMHPLLIFLSTIGGIAVFGVSGFVIGPIITALLSTLWEIYEKHYQ